MNLDWREGVKSASYIGLLLTASLLFLTLGSDDYDQLRLRMGVGGVVSALFLLAVRGNIRKLFTGNPASLFLFYFSGYIVLRAAWALLSQLFPRFSHGADSLLVYQYVQSAVRWVYASLLFLTGYYLLRSRLRTSGWLWASAGCGLFLALNALPPLFSKGYADYTRGELEPSFFYPALYFHPWIRRFFLGSYAHPNYAGDVIAFGIFSALGIFLYSLFSLSPDRGRLAGDHLKRSERLIALGMPLCMVGATSLAVFLIFSRGTILSFVFSLVVFLTVALWKFPSRKQFVFSFLALVSILGFLVWSGKSAALWKELSTVQREFDAEKEGSLSANREGARRALAILREYPVWGVGTGGYRLVSKNFASPGTEGSMASKTVYCHYLETLAEEGVGGLLYFLFIGAYFIEVSRGLKNAKSRFQFIAGLSLFAPVLMVFLHASFGLLMQRISLSTLVYIWMGASLGVLSKDYRAS